MIQSCKLAIVGAVLLTTAIILEAQTRVPDLGTIVQRLEQTQEANHGNVRPYQVTRQYLFYEGHDKPQADSSVVADVSYYPPNTKQFEIVNASGGGRGQHVVRTVLEHESEMATDWHKTAITRKNYEFSLLGEETLNGRRCFILGLEPRRKSKELLDGKAWIDARDYHIIQIQGEPSKSPSFWIKKVNVTLYFSNVQGMWLQTAIRAVADVRFLGTNILSERDLNYRVGAESVAKRPPRNPEINIAAYVR
ncbi:MAG: hypothetical protein ROO76_11145 [Terriglobia bacterium]|nr:hypothetical protein [Terriglobia bacterium]